MREKMKTAMPVLLTALCLLQPCLDVLSYFLEKGGFGNGLSSVLRLGMLAVIAVGGFALSKRRGYYFGLAGILAAFTLCHMAACVQDGYAAPGADFANLLRIYQLPIMTLCFITFLQTGEDARKGLRRGIFFALCLIALVELLSVVTNTNPYTYANKSVGILGWFGNTSPQSAILATAAPIAIAWAMERWQKNLWLIAGASVLALGLLYLFATRLAYVSLLGIAAGFCLCMPLVRKCTGMPVRRAFAAMLACLVLALAGYGISPMVKNQSMVAVNREKKAAEIAAMVAADEKAALAAGLSEEQVQLQRLKTAYEKYLPGPTGRFGLEATAQYFGYCDDVTVIADMRQQRLCFCHLTAENAHPLAKFFGVEREDLSYNSATYDAENDFHGIFYLCGAVGLALLLLFLGTFLRRILYALRRDFRGTFTVEAVGCGLALVCCLAHAYFTSGVLRRPNAIFYLAAVLAMIWDLTNKKKESA